VNKIKLTSNSNEKGKTEQIVGGNSGQAPSLALLCESCVVIASRSVKK
jgi:hypothetical protein